MPPFTLLCFRGLKSGFLKIWRPIARAKSKTLVSWIHESQNTDFAKTVCAKLGRQLFRSEDLTSAIFPLGEAENFSWKEIKKRDDSLTAKTLCTLKTLCNLLSDCLGKQHGGNMEPKFCFCVGHTVQGSIYNWGLCIWSDVEGGCLYCILYSNNCSLYLQQKRQES